MTMAHFTLRLPPTVVYEVEKIAAREHLPLRTLVRSWIMQRVDEEADKVKQKNEKRREKT